MARTLHTHKKDVNMEDIKRKIKNNADSLVYNGVNITEGSKQFAYELYDQLLCYYKFNPSMVKSNFCDLWDALHDSFHLNKLNKGNKDIDKLKITWNVIFNATVVKPWCNVKRGMLAQLRKPLLKHFFEDVIQHGNDVKRTQGILTVLPEKLKQSFRKISDGKGLVSSWDD